VSQVNIGPTAYVPEIAVVRSAGEYDFQPSGDSWPVPVDWAHGKQLVAARIAGDCVEPELMKGDTVIVDLARRDPGQGDLVAVLTEEGILMVKRFNRFQGIPMLVDNRNRLYPLELSEIQGIIVSALRRYK
jgi:phage repressor protein C with HTH and peptisase S24 domain